MNHDERATELVRLAALDPTIYPDLIANFSAALAECERRAREEQRRADAGIARQYGVEMKRRGAAETFHSAEYVEAAGEIAAILAQAGPAGDGERERLAEVGGIVERLALNPRHGAITIAADEAEGAVSVEVFGAPTIDVGAPTLLEALRAAERGR